MKIEHAAAALVLAAMAASAWAAAPAAPPGSGTSRANADVQARAAFDRLDTDRDGTISRGEAGPDVRAVITRARVEAAGSMDRLFGRIDADGSGQISREEFRRWPGGSPARVTVLAPPDVPMPPAPPRAPAAPLPPLPPLPPEVASLPGMARAERVMTALRFDQIDTNRDGKVSRAEALADARDRFDRLDRNRDGRVDAEERGVRVHIVQRDTML